MEFDFSGRVRNLADERGLSITQIEKMAGWKRGQLFTALKLNSPTLKTVCRICEVFEIELIDFFSTK